jgi:lysophospholipase L1-like esterase
MKRVVTFAEILKSRDGLFVAAFMIASLVGTYYFYRTPQNSALFYTSAFAFGLSLVGFVIVARHCLAPAAIIAANCLATFALLLLPVDHLFRAIVETDENVSPVFSFSEARSNPKAFAKWWKNYVAEWQKLAYKIERPDPAGELPFVLIPSSSVQFFEAEIRINNLGFRGPDFNLEKGNKFRIVAIGESPVFGATIRKTDRPWPEVLSDLIATSYRCDRPIEVVNAGVEAWNIKNQVQRFDRDILPLKPDLVISYHGVNGAGFLSTKSLKLANESPPALRPRASSLLAYAEFLVRLYAWKLKNKINNTGSKPMVSDAELLETEYAKLYYSLAKKAHDQGFSLALATFNMAVDGNSPDEAIKFYEQGFPSLRSGIVAAGLHNRLVALVSKDTNSLFIDATRNLQGKYDEDYFLDAFHFTQKGRDQLARDMFQGISPILEANARTRCIPRENLVHR